MVVLSAQGWAWSVMAQENWRATAVAVHMTSVGVPPFDSRRFKMVSDSTFGSLKLPEPRPVAGWVSVLLGLGVSPTDEAPAQAVRVSAAATTPNAMRLVVLLVRSGVMMAHLILCWGTNRLDCPELVLNRACQVFCV